MTRCSLDCSDDDYDLDFHADQQRDLAPSRQEIKTQSPTSSGKSRSSDESSILNLQRGQEEEEARLTEQFMADVACLDELMALAYEEEASVVPAKNDDGDLKTPDRKRGRSKEPNSEEARTTKTLVLPIRNADEAKDNESTPPPRKRFRGKQTVSSGTPEPQNTPEKVKCVDFDTNTDFEETTFEEFKQWVEKADKSDACKKKFLKDFSLYGWNCIRNRYVSEHMKEKKDVGSEVNAQERKKLRQQFSKLTETQKADYAQEKKNSGAISCKKELYGICLRFGIGVNRKETEDDNADDVKFLQAAFCMLAYFDPKWSFKPRHGWGELDDIARFEELCQKDAYVKNIKAKVETEVERLKTELFAVNWAYSLELCPKLFEEGKLQIHVAVVLRWNGQQKYRNGDKFKLLGVQPQHVKAQMRKKDMKRADSPEPMFYYLQCPKDGMLFHDSNYKPFQDFVVNDKWLNPFLQSGKMRVSKAIQEHYSRTTVGVRSEHSRTTVSYRLDTVALQSVIGWLLWQYSRLYSRNTVGSTTLHTGVPLWRGPRGGRTGLQVVSKMLTFNG